MMFWKKKTPNTIKVVYDPQSVPLQPCPFCGGIPIERTCFDDDAAYTSVFVVSKITCGKCKFEFKACEPMHITSDGLIYFDNRHPLERAAEMWNTRGGIVVEPEK